MLASPGEGVCRGVCKPRWLLAALPARLPARMKEAESEERRIKVREKRGPNEFAGARVQLTDSCLASLPDKPPSLLRSDHLHT